MNARRFSAIAGLELRTCLTRPLFWILIVSLLLVTATMNPDAMIPSGDPTAGGARPFVNTPYAMAQIFALSATLLYSFFASILGGLSVIRDDEHRVSDLLHGTPLTPAEYILGKFAGILAALGLALLLHVLFAITLYQLVPVENPETIRGPFKIASFLVPALVFAAPLICLCAGLSFAIGERTRKPLLVAAVPLVLFLACVFFLWRWTPSWLDPGIDRVLMIVDPSSLRWLRQTLFRFDRGVEFYNTQPLALDGTFLWNRILTLFLPALAVLASIRHCAATIAGDRAPRRQSRAHAAQAGPAPCVSRPHPTRSRSLGELKMTAVPPGFLAAAFQIGRAELRELRAHPGLYLFAPMLMLSVWEYAASAGGAFDAPVWMTAGRLAVGTIERVTICVCLLLLFYTVESMSRERATGFEPILYASPFRTGALLLAKGLANALVAAVVLLCIALAGLVFLASQGGGRIEIWPMIVVWGLVVPPTLLVWSTFVTAVLAIVRERYTTYAIGLVVLALSAFHHTRQSMSWVYNWNLWGTLRWSDMGTFELNGRALLLNRLAMVALAIFFAALAGKCFVRVERDPVRNQQRLAARGLLRGALGLAPFALLPILAGTFLALEIRAGFQGGAVAQRDGDYRRRNLATWGDFVPPTVTRVDLRIDLEPAEARMDVEGAYTLVNLTDGTMRRLPFTVGPAFRDLDWAFNGAPVASDDRSGLHVLQPGEPVQPGDSFEVGFVFRAVFPEGVTRNGGGVSEFILPSGVVLHGLGRNLAPVPGFEKRIGVNRENRVDPPEVAEDFWKEQLEPVGGMPLPFDARIEITAPSEYTANSVGVKTAERSREGRTTVVWETDHPVKALNVVAGRWDVRRKDGTAVFYHPGHPYNVEEIADALVAARKRYSEWFHPYPWRELRISQFPNLLSNARGFPTNIQFSEQLGFLAKSDPRAPEAFIVTAHEAAHQWWGHLLTPGEGPGADVLIEGMAHYATLLLLESEKGLHGRIEFTRRLEESYTFERRVDSERPLARIGDDGRPGDASAIYDKGAWVMWMLHNHLGRERMLAGLREFIRSYRDGPDYPALHDLIETLRPHAVDAHDFQSFVDQWFFEVVVPELRIADATVTQTSTGWSVSARVENVGSGSVTVEVAAIRGDRFADGVEDAAGGYDEVRRSVRLVPGHPERLSWTLDFEPERLVADPDALVLQLNRNRAIAEL